MQRSGYADMPLHYGHVPPWLAERMVKLSRAIIENIVYDYGKDEVLRRLSDPFWFQSLGCVIGMDWHSSGITTTVMGALKKAINPLSHEIGIYVCGGRGKFSRQTPDELIKIADKKSLNGNDLVYKSRFTAKIDNTAIQDGFQLYLHSFILTDQGNWTVVQQGMNQQTSQARRYHWHSPQIKSFLEEPHTSIYGQNQGQILNLTHKDAASSKEGIIRLTQETPHLMLEEIKKIVMPKHHELRSSDVNLKRLGAMLAVAHEKQFRDFEPLLMLEGVGPRTVQSLALVSEVIHGTPTRFSDPARFSFAHGGKDGHPLPVPVKTYDETISFLRDNIEKSKMGVSDKNNALKALVKVSQAQENDFIPNNNFEDIVEKERSDSWKYGGRTVFGNAKKPHHLKITQLNLFD